MITVYAKSDTDYSRNGLRVLDRYVESAAITEELNGEYVLDIMLRADDSDYANAVEAEMVIKAPAPVRPSIMLRNMETHKVYKTNTAAPMRTNASYVKGKVLRTLKSGTKVIWTRTSNNGSWYNCTTMNGESGWVEVSKLEYFGESSTTAEGYQVTPQQSQDQLFRVVNVSHTLDGVEVHAEHISYDLRGNYIRSLNMQNTAGASALAQLLDECEIEHEFEGYSDVTATASIDASRKNPIDVLLGEEGFLQYDAQLLRDNYNLYLMASVGENRGASIAYRKNITSMTVEVDTSEVITRIIPIGYWASGDPMFLEGTIWVESENASDYAFHRVMELDCKDVKKGAGYADAPAVRAKIAELAAAEFEKGLDVPAVTIDVDYVHVPGLGMIYLGDKVMFKHDGYGFDMEVQVIGYTWDALNQRYTAIQLSNHNPRLSSLRIDKNMIPPNAITARTVAPQTVTASAFAPGAAEAIIATEEPDDPQANRLMMYTTGAGQSVLQRFDGDEWRAVSAGGVVSPQSDDGTPHTTVDSAGGFLPRLTSPQVATRYSGPTNLVVNSATDPDGVTYFSTVYDAMESVRGHRLDGDVTITVSEFYNDFNAIDITGLYGSGSLAIDGGSVVGGVDSRMVVYNAVRVANCSLPVTLNGLRAKHSATPLNITACTFVLVNDCVFETTASVEVVGVRRGSTVRLTGTTMAAGNFSVRAYDGSRVTLNNCTGTANICSEASMISGYGTMPSGSSSSVTTTAYQNGYVSGTGGMTVSRGSGAGTIPSVPATGDIETLYPKETAWHQDIWCEPNQVGFFRQGYTGYGQITGCMWFDMSSLEGLTIAGATLRLTRSAGYGMTDAVSVRILALGPNCKKRGDTMVRGTVYGTIGSILPGETKTFTLPASAVEHMISGAIGGICVFATDAAKASGYLWSKNYAQFEGTAGNNNTKPLLTVYL